MGRRLAPGGRAPPRHARVALLAEGLVCLDPWWPAHSSSPADLEASQSPSTRLQTRQLTARQRARLWTADLVRSCTYDRSERQLTPLGAPSCGSKCRAPLSVTCRARGWSRSQRARILAGATHGRLLSLLLSPTTAAFKDLGLGRDLRRASRRVTGRRVDAVQSQLQAEPYRHYPL